MFVRIDTVYVPVDDGKKDNVLMIFLILYSYTSLKVMTQLHILNRQVKKYYRSMRELQERN